MPSGYEAHQVTRARQRREHIASLYLQGRSQASIAKELQVTQQQISYDLKQLHKAWQASALVDIHARKAIELQKIDAIERAAWEGWERSIPPREITITEAAEGGEIILGDGTKVPKAPTRKASVRRENQAGDPRFLERIQKCIDQRCAILGIGEAQQAMKQAGEGLAALLDEARAQTVLPPAASMAPPMAEA